MLHLSGPVGRGNGVVGNRSDVTVSLVQARMLVITLGTASPG